MYSRIKNVCRDQLNIFFGGRKERGVFLHDLAWYKSDDEGGW